MKTFKHSGTLGDIIYSLPVMRALGGGEFYLHLNQVAWIAKHYYNSVPSEYHQNKMSTQDLEFMYDFMMQQSYIHKFEPLTPHIEITHNLDRFRPAFVHHPANYIQIYCEAFGINDTQTQNDIISTPWISVRQLNTKPGRPIVVNRTARGFSPQQRNPQWDQWRSQEWDKRAVFIGLEQEYEEFRKWSSWDLTYYPTKNLLEIAEIIAAAELFIGNQSMALALAQGLGTPYAFEHRRDLPLNRNESFFPTHTQGSTF